MLLALPYICATPFYMKVVIRNATIHSTASSFYRQSKDIFIENGIISAIGSQLKVKADKEIQYPGLHVSAGWMDIFAHFCEPGYEHRETLHSGAWAATAGGFTDVMLIPNTDPVIGSKSQVAYIRDQNDLLPVTLHPIAAVTRNADGKELSEMYDMHAHGAIAFSDGIKPMQDTAVLMKALLYLLPVNGTLIQVPDTTALTVNGLMHEGLISTRLGLPGKPALAEELAILKDIELLKYTHSKLHITGVSTAKSIDLIKKAKLEGLQLSCSVTPYHLCFCDEDLADYDTNLKVNPPLRSRTDMEALQIAAKDGTIDCIASHHMPRHNDEKDCEFEYAKYGMISLQNVFGILNQFIPTEKLIEMLSIVPRKIFDVPVPVIEEGAKASLTLFNPHETYIFERSMIRSLSYNSPFIGKEMKGRIIGTVCKGKLNMIHE